MSHVMRKLFAPQYDWAQRTKLQKDIVFKILF